MMHSKLAHVAERHGRAGLLGAAIRIRVTANCVLIARTTGS